MSEETKCPKLSEEQMRLVEHLKAREGMALMRFPGGFWTTGDILKPSKYMQFPPRGAWFGTKTIQALLKRGVLVSTRGNTTYDYRDSYLLSTITRAENGDL